MTVGWADVSKGDGETPDIRSRLVARQIRAAGKDPMSAPTPPFEALRTVLRYSAADVEGAVPRCRDGKSPERVQILIGISRAYFNAKCDTESATFLCLPTEDSDHQGVCGLLMKHMYDTQAAADGSQRECSSTLIEQTRLHQGVASPCAFWNKERDLVCSVHGDDLTTAGAKPNLDWFES